MVASVSQFACQTTGWTSTKRAGPASSDACSATAKHGSSRDRSREDPLRLSNGTSRERATAVALDYCNRGCERASAAGGRAPAGRPFGSSDACETLASTGREPRTRCLRCMTTRLRVAWKGAGVSADAGARQFASIFGGGCSAAARPATTGERDERAFGRPFAVSGLWVVRDRWSGRRLAHPDLAVVIAVGV
jgi:hypothetical protein